MSSKVIEEQSCDNDPQITEVSVSLEISDNSGFDKPSCKRQRKPESWKRNIRKALNDHGREHVDSTGKLKAKKTLLVLIAAGLNIQKKINDDERSSINAEYWSLADYSRKIFFYYQMLK